MSETAFRGTVAEYLADALPFYGVSHVFELAGGMITFLLDELHASDQVEVISMHHEQGAGFAAEGFSRQSGLPAVAMATSGPGATNLLTAVGSCYFDSVPVVFITGQVNTTELRFGSDMRQGGFQETDIVAMSKPVTKWSKLVDDPAEFPSVLGEAFRVAQDGRPGPVLLDIPMDIQRSTLLHAPVGPSLILDTLETKGSPARDDFIRELVDALRGSRRPLVIAGGGIRSAGAVGALRDLVESWGIPVVASLMGIDAMPHDSPLYVGMLGSYGNRVANWAVSQSDLLVVLGSRLDIRQTGSDIAGFAGRRQLFHVDVDPAELNARVPGGLVLNDDLRAWLPCALEADGVDPRNFEEWVGEIAEFDRTRAAGENVTSTGLDLNSLMQSISTALPEDAIYVTDVGQHQMWAAQSVSVAQSSRFLSSGGMGSMGFGLPAAIGASLAAPTRTVCLIAGDGGFQCNIQELQTVVRLRLPLIMVIIDNGCHGMVRQFQESYLEGRYFSTRWGYSAPDFVRVANAYGIDAVTVLTEGEAVEAVRAASHAQRAVLAHLKIDPGLNVYPKMAFGQPFGSMEPDVAPLDIEGT